MKKSLSPDTDFTVTEEKLLNYILATLLFALFIYGLIDSIRNGFEHIRTIFFVTFFVLVGAILFFRKARSKRVYLRVNKTGIYADEQLVTDWPNFLNAYIHEVPPKWIRVRDNFELVIEHTKSGSEMGFRKRIKLTNTQNKSEEDILAAIKFFWQDFQSNR